MEVLDADDRQLAQTVGINSRFRHDTTRPANVKSSTCIPQAKSDISQNHQTHSSATGNERLVTVWELTTTRRHVHRRLDCAKEADDYIHRNGCRREKCEPAVIDTSTMAASYKFPTIDSDIGRPHI